MYITTDILELPSFGYNDNLIGLRWVCCRADVIPNWHSCLSKFLSCWQTCLFVLVVDIDVDVVVDDVMGAVLSSGSGSIYCKAQGLLMLNWGSPAGILVLPLVAVWMKGYCQIQAYWKL